MSDAKPRTAGDEGSLRADEHFVQDTEDLAKQSRGDRGMILYSNEVLRLCKLAKRAMAQRVVEREARIAELEQSEYDARKALWAGHGHMAEIYGDDGEMQCCGKNGVRHNEWDFLRTPLPDLCRMIANERGELEAEVARLREALGCIASAGPAVYLDAVRAFARKTLDEKEEGK